VPVAPKIHSHTGKPYESIKPLISLGQSLPQSERVQFDAKTHIQFPPPSKVYSMKELGYRDDIGVSHIGVSKSFPLFKADAIRQMREEILSDDAWSHYQYSSNLARCQLRGFAAE
jgi:hypothetical protein